jgi:hypothetical protein
MIAGILALSVRMRWLVAFLTLIVDFGAWQITKLPIDAVPDVTNRGADQHLCPDVGSGRHREASHLPGGDGTRYSRPGDDALLLAQRVQPGDGGFTDD